MEEGAGFDAYQMFLERPHQVLTVICRQLEGLLTRETWRLLSAVASTVSLFYLGNPEMIFYAATTSHGGAMLCGTVSELAAQLQATLWRRNSHCPDLRHPCRWEGFQPVPHRPPA